MDSATESVVGLVLEENHNLDNLREYGKGSFLVDSNGRVFIDGLEKTTVLPKFEKNLKVPKKLALYIYFFVNNYFLHF